MKTLIELKKFHNDILQYKNLLEIGLNSFIRDETIALEIRRLRAVLQRNYSSLEGNIIQYGRSSSARNTKTINVQKVFETAFKIVRDGNEENVFKAIEVALEIVNRAIGKLQKERDSWEIPTESKVNRSDEVLSSVDGSEKKFMRLAIKEAKKSRSEDNRIHPKVGVVVVKDNKVIGIAYRGEFDPGDHAEFALFEKKLKNKILAGSTVYTTLEPCTTRNHPKLPCAKRIIERRIHRVVIGMLDPNPKIRGKGLMLLREANIVTELFTDDLMAQVEDMNREFLRFHKKTRGESK
ncbi:MAG: deaminase [Dehalococcoidia bacterium]